MPSPVFQGFIGIVMKIRFKIPVIFWVQDIWPESAFLGLNLSNKHIAKSFIFISKVIYRKKR